MKAEIKRNCLFLSIESKKEAIQFEKLCKFHGATIIIPKNTKKYASAKFHNINITPIS